MPVIEITSLEHPGVEVFSTLTEAQLRNRIDPQRGIFIAESPKVIRVALEAGYEPVSLLCERKHLTGDAEDIVYGSCRRPLIRYVHIPDGHLTIYPHLPHAVLPNVHTADCSAFPR